MTTNASGSQNVARQASAQGPSSRNLKPAYSELYLADAMTVLAELFDYAVNDYGAEGDEVADAFCLSPISSAFGNADPRYVGGMSGAEVFCELNRAWGAPNSPCRRPTVRYDRTPEYWAGWVMAFAQWRLNVSFERLFEILPFPELMRLYPTLHEASEERFAGLVLERLLSAKAPTRLGLRRRAAGYTQRELAHVSGVGLRSIQLYEQRQKDINCAKAGSLLALARELCCSIEDLLEPEALAAA